MQKCLYIVLIIYLTASYDDANQLFVVGANASHGFVQARGKVVGLICDTLVDGN